MLKYLMIFFVSMVPLVELRLAMPMAVGMDLPYFPALIVCVLGNMLPVPIIYFFARKVLVWGFLLPRALRKFRVDPLASRWMGICLNPLSASLFGWMRKKMRRNDLWQNIKVKR